MVLPKAVTTEGVGLETDLDTVTLDTFLAEALLSLHHNRTSRPVVGPKPAGPPVSPFTCPSVPIGSGSIKPDILWAPGGAFGVQCLYARSPDEVCDVQIAVEFVHRYARCPAGPR